MIYAGSAESVFYYSDCILDYEREFAEFFVHDFATRTRKYVFGKKEKAISFLVAVKEITLERVQADAYYPDQVLSKLELALIKTQVAFFGPMAPLSTEMVQSRKKRHKEQLLFYGSLASLGSSYLTWHELLRGRYPSRVDLEEATRPLLEAQKQVTLVGEQESSRSNDTTRADGFHNYYISYCRARNEMMSRCYGEVLS